MALPTTVISGSRLPPSQRFSCLPKERRVCPSLEPGGCAVLLPGIEKGTAPSHSTFGDARRARYGYSSPRAGFSDVMGAFAEAGSIAVPGTPAPAPALHRSNSVRTGMTGLRSETWKGTQLHHGVAFSCFTTGGSEAYTEAGTSLRPLGVLAGPG